MQTCLRGCSLHIDRARSTQSVSSKKGQKCNFADSNVTGRSQLPTLEHREHLCDRKKRYLHGGLSNMVCLHHLYQSSAGHLAQDLPKSETFAKCDCGEVVSQSNASSTCPKNRRRCFLIWKSQEHRKHDRKHDRRPLQSSGMLNFCIRRFNRVLGYQAAVILVPEAKCTTSRESSSDNCL